ncbi:hypothetical protein LCGC14_3050750, partial [marine sediment metagenome]
ISGVTIDARTSNRISGIRDVRTHLMKIKEEIKQGDPILSRFDILDL